MRFAVIKHPAQVLSWIILINLMCDWHAELQSVFVQFNAGIPRRRCTHIWIRRRSDWWQEDSFPMHRAPNCALYVQRSELQPAERVRGKKRDLKKHHQYTSIFFKVQCQMHRHGSSLPSVFTLSLFLRPNSTWKPISWFWHVATGTKGVGFWC